jgi:hypothetical protein
MMKTPSSRALTRVLPSYRATQTTLANLRARRNLATAVEPIQKVCFLTLARISKD